MELLSIKFDLPVCGVQSEINRLPHIDMDHFNPQEHVRDPQCALQKLELNILEADPPIW